MKRIIATVFAAVMMLVCMVSCGKERDPKYIGKWEAADLTVNGKSESNFLGVPIGALFRFEMDDKGKVTWKSAIDNKVIQNANNNTEITWEETEPDVIEFTVKDTTGKNDTSTMTLHYRDGKLVIEENSSAININKVEEFTEVDAEALNAAASVVQNFGITQ
jgi:hypothetical protein